MIRLMHDDCIRGMNQIEDGSVDMVLADPPYGTTACKWDSVIALEPMWEQLKRIIKPNGVIVLTAQTPFDKVLGCSNLGMLKYEWVWEKTAATGHLNAKKQPMKAHEKCLVFSDMSEEDHANVLVFYAKQPTYNPQKTSGHNPVNSYTKHTMDGDCYGKTKVGISGGGSTERYPRSVLLFPSDKQKSALHPTQKPVALMRYFIETYTNEGEIVLDFCAGSGTTGVACKELKRDFIGIEKDADYFDIACKRINAES